MIIIDDDDDDDDDEDDVYYIFACNLHVMLILLEEFSFYTFLSFFFSFIFI